MTKQARLQGLGVYATLGFTLERIDDDTIELHHQGEFITRFSQKGATPESLAEVSLNHLKEKHPDDTKYWPEPYHFNKWS